MALLHNDIFSNEAVDDPEDLDLLVEGRGQEDNETAEQATGDNSDKEEKKDDQPEKKKRKQSQRPRLNILRLMDNNTGLLAAERMFKDVKFKGKGHELEDLNLIMKKMEIWAHKLYPSFDFDDCLAKLEKLGNTRSVATYVKKLRMGLEDDIVTPQHDDEDGNENANNDNTEENQPPPRANSPGRFDQLVRNQPQNEPAQGGLTEEQRERMRKNRLIAEQRRAARMKELREKQQRMAAGNAVSSQSPFQITSDDNAPVIAHSQQNNSSVFQNTLNSECDSTIISQTEKDVAVNNSTQIGGTTQDKDEVGHGDIDVPMNISTEIGETTQDKDEIGKTTKDKHEDNDVPMNINSEICETTHDKDEIGVTTQDKDVSMSISTEIGETTQDKDEDRDVSRNINAEISETTQDKDENVETCGEPEQATRSLGTANNVSVNLPENSYDFFEPMDDIEMEELP